MRFNFLSLIGVAFFLLAIWRALKVRRDLASGETRWERAVFGRRPAILRTQSPGKYWTAVIANTVIVFLFGLVTVAVFRAARF